MSMMTDTVPATSHPGWFSRSEAWLDSKGKGAWIAAMVLGFVFFWPIGLALLFYMIWSKRMFNSSCSRRASWKQRRMTMTSSTGNSLACFQNGFGSVFSTGCTYYFKLTRIFIQEHQGNVV